MKIEVVASTHQNFIASKQEFENLGGHSAGVCYMSGTFADITQEDIEKTQRRIAQTKDSFHHSVYDHSFITLSLTDIPKALAMVLNNEKMYTTSEKSARYTKMTLNDKEQEIFSKWYEIFKDVITRKYQAKFPAFFTDKRIEKLSQENARYLISVFTPTSMVYTTSYRQLNLIYAFMKKEIERKNKSAFYKRLTIAMQDFCEEVQTLGYIDEKLSRNEKERELSLFKENYCPREYFGDVYSVTYLGSFAQLAQAQRHRTLSYSISFPKTPQFYVPPIIHDDKNLVKDWKNDCAKQTKIFPQGMMVNINESGKLDNFILKMKERKCTFAQLEINQQTSATLKKYVSKLVSTDHPLASELKQYDKGSRCTFKNYSCATPCGFPEGITEQRQI